MSTNFKWTRLVASVVMVAPIAVYGAVAVQKAKPQVNKVAVQQLDQKKVEMIALKDKATEITKKIGELAASGKALDDQDTMDQMKKMVDELTAIKAHLDTMSAEIDALKKWAEGDEKAMTALKNDVSRLKGTKPSAYIQFQYNDTDRPGGAFDAFRLRRVRVGFTHQADPRTSAKVTFDLATGPSQRTAEMKDAFISYDFDPSQGIESVKGRVGQQALPLGYELERSSSDREFPERAQYNQAMFRGERSRGVLFRKGFDGGFSAFVGAFNALSVDDPEQATLSSGPGNRLAAAVGLRSTGARHDFGVSYLAGERPEFTSGSGATAVTAPKINRRFLYLDGTYNFDSRLFLRAEGMIGSDRLPSATAVATADEQDMSGYQVHFGYNLNPRNQLNLRYEQFDPNTDTGGNLFSGIGLSYIYWINPSTKLMGAYESFLDRARTSEKGYHVTTVRVQFKF